jgi:putative RecB family exonuclease
MCTVLVHGIEAGSSVRNPLQADDAALVPPASCCSHGHCLAGNPKACADSSTPVSGQCLTVSGIKNIKKIMIYIREKEEEAAGVLPDTQEAFHEFRWKAWWCVENYFEMEDPSEIILDGIETQCEIDIDGVQMKGFIDRWEFKDDGTIRIGDYKTGKTPRPQYTDDKFQQLYIYAHLLGTMTDAVVSEVELLYLKDGVRFNRPVTSDDLNEIAVTVKTVRSEVESCCETGEFPAIKHRLCDWCSYKTFCPAWV